MKFKDKQVLLQDEKLTLCIIKELYIHSNL